MKPIKSFFKFRAVFATIVFVLLAVLLLPGAVFANLNEDIPAAGLRPNDKTAGDSTTPVDAAQDSLICYNSPLAIANVAIFQNSNPWGYTKNQDVLAANGISYTIYNAASMGTVNLSIYDKVIIASVQDSSFYSALQTNISWFENYVSAGGILDIHAATQGDQPSLPGGFVITYKSGNAVSIIDANHPIVTTPHVISDAELDGWNSSVHCYISTVPSGAHEILRVTDSGQPCAMDLKLGQGRIFVTTQTIDWTGASYNYLENTILYAVTTPAKLAVTPWDGFISSGESGGPYTPYSKIYTLTNADSNSLDWTAAKTAAWLDITPAAGTLNPGESNDVGIVINATANTLTPGTYNDTVTFTDVTNGSIQSRTVTLTIRPAGFKNILAYIQYSDNSATGEYQNTLTAIRSVSTNFTVTELTNYTQLSTLLPERNVLLIPEQETTSNSTLQSIGATWAPILQNFVNEGGVVIVCDYTAGYGILNGAGLMNIISSSTFYNQSVNVIAPDDPVAQGVGSTYTGSDGSLYFNTTEGRAVVERPGYGPVVINKEMGFGSVVLIGHDYYASNAQQDRIVGNAVFNLPPVHDNLSISPAADINSSGPQGGPFTPSAKVYTLTNTGPNSLDWTAAATAPWIDVNTAGGTLASGDSVIVDVSFNADANSLSPGDYGDTITFTNTTSGFAQHRHASLKVLVVPGEIEITDSIPPVDDLNMPFGNVFLNTAKTEQIIITNTDPTHELTINMPRFEGFYDDFTTTTLDPDKWPVITGSPTVDDIGLSEPSPLYSLRLDSTDAVESKVIDLSGLSGVKLVYWYEQTGGGESPDPGNDLIIEYYNGTSWVELERQLGSGPDMAYYEQRTIMLPAEAMHSRFKLRIRAAGDAGFDDWFVDNVSISMNDGEGRNPGTLGTIPLGKAFRLENVPDLPAVIPPMGNVTLDVVFEANSIGEYSSSVVIQSNDVDEPNLTVQLSGTAILDYLQIVPVQDFEFSGHPGGPFLPSNKSYWLTNNGPVDVNWTAAGAEWFNITPFEGIIKPGEMTKVTITPNSSARSKPKGTYPAQLIFTDQTTAIQQIRNITLNIYTDPKVWSTPPSFNVTVPHGHSQTESLTIGNGGDGLLNFSITSRQTGFTPSAPATLNLAADASVETQKDIAAMAPSNHNFAALTSSASFAEGKILVRFAPQADRQLPTLSAKNSILAKAGDGRLKTAQVTKEYKHVRGLSAVKLPPNVGVAEALSVLNSAPGILYAEPDYKLKALGIPNDSRFSELWGLNNTGQSGGTPDADIDAPEAWDIATGTTNIVVAVIDTGVDYTHPDLAPNMWVNTAELNGTPGVDDDGNGYVDDVYGYDFRNTDADPMDDHFHGTHVAGTIAAVRNNGQGIAGVSGNVKIMALKFLDSGGSGVTTDAIECLQYAILMGAKLSSNSWGGGAYSQALKDSIDAAGNANQLFVAAAGNDYGSNNDTTPSYPSSYASANIIAVLATDRYDNMASFSNYGPTSVDIGAPGTDILSCQPRGSYQLLSGTSMATPHVSGAAAVVWSMFPSMSYLEVKNALLTTVDKTPAMAGRCVSQGRLNLFNAIKDLNVAWLETVPPTGTVATGDTNNIAVSFHGDVPVGTYQGQIKVSTNDPYTPDINIPVTMTVEPLDFFAELFDSGANDMANRTLTFIPDGSTGCYKLCNTQSPSTFYVDPADGTTVSLGDDDYCEVQLPNKSVSLYGVSYSTFYIGSNGYITFDSGDTHYLERFTEHFALPRISALFDDLNPAAGGTISYKILNNRVAVTFENIHEFSMTSTNSFQIEMFFNGKIRITFLNIAATDGLTGISEGYGVPQYFSESNLSDYGQCEICRDGDFNEDGNVNAMDITVFAGNWMKDGCALPDWCGGTDLDLSTAVDLYDFAIFAQNWLEGKAP